LWVAHFLVHRLDALIRLSQSHPLDPFSRLVLEALTLGTDQSATELNSHLHLGRHVVQQVVRSMADLGLIQADPGGGWSLTGQGQQARQDGTFTQVRHERQQFCFREGLHAGRPLQFLNLNRAANLIAGSGEDRTFNIRILQECLHRPPDWKRRQGFPPQVEAIVGAEAAAPSLVTGDGEPPEWQRVIVDQPGRLAAVLVLTAGRGSERLLGFAVEPPGWALALDKPVLELGVGWREAFPELLEEPAEGLWRLAWNGWCRTAAVPTAESEACRIKRLGHRLQVQPPRSLLERLRAGRHEVLKGDTWVLAGKDRLRCAAVLEIGPAGA
jgi:hypothetical protein